jgi:hypothetical protein
MELIIGILLFAAYSAAYWFLKLVSLGKLPRERYLNHDEGVYIALGTAALSIILYMLYRSEYILILGGVLTVLVLLFRALEKYLSTHFGGKISNGGFLGLFVLALVIFFTIAAVIN